MLEAHYKEIKLSRELSNEINKALQSDANCLPDNVRIAYMRLYGEYIRQQQSEDYIP